MLLLRITLTMSAPYVVGDSDRQPTLVVAFDGSKSSAENKMKPGDTALDCCVVKGQCGFQPGGAAKFVLLKFQIMWRRSFDIFACSGIRSLASRDR